VTICGRVKDDPIQDVLDSGHVRLLSVSWRPTKFKVLPFPVKIGFLQSRSAFPVCTLQKQRNCPVLLLSQTSLNVFFIPNFYLRLQKY